MLDLFLKYGKHGSPLDKYNKKFNFMRKITDLVI
jgi:hypothetical protein